MMTPSAYLSFRNRIDPIIRACSVPEIVKDRFPQNDLAAYQGETSFTAGKTFYFSVSRAKSYQKELLAICRDLPKMDAVLPGTACTISSLALVRRVARQSMLTSQFEVSEQFFALLTLADIASFRAFTSKGGITYLNANITIDFKDIVAP